MKLKKNNNNPINHTKNLNELTGLSLDINNNLNLSKNEDMLNYSAAVYALFVDHLNFLVDDSTFYNRDRLIIDSKSFLPLLYGMYFLSGRDAEIKDLKDKKYLESNFKIGTICPDALCYSVGAALGERHVKGLLNVDGVSYNIYTFLSPEKLSSGLSYSSARLAVSLKLNNLIAISENKYDLYSEYENLGFNVISTDNNYEKITSALDSAKKSNMPSLVLINTSSYDYDINNISDVKNKLNVRDIEFAISNDVMEDIEYLIDNRVKNLEKTFKSSIANLDSESSLILKALLLNNKRVSSSNIVFMPEDGASNLENSCKLLNSYFDNTNILINTSTDFDRFKNTIGDGVLRDSDYKNVNIDLSLNKHSGSYIINGLTESGLRPVIYSDIRESSYFLPAIEYAKENHLPIIYVLVGKSPFDITNLRNIDIDMFTPFDTNELVGSFKAVMSKEEDPSIIVVCEKNMEIFDASSINDTVMGGYVIEKEKLEFDGILVSSSEDVELAIDVSKKLFSKGLDFRVVSVPNLKRFLEQSEEYRDNVLPVEKRKIIIENSSSTYWNKIVFNSKYILNSKDFNELDDNDAFAKKIESLIK